MGINFDLLYSVCQSSFGKLEKSYKEILKKEDNGKIRIQYPSAIIDRIGNLVRDAEVALQSKEDIHLNHLYILCRLEAIDALLWVLGTSPDCIKNRAEVFQAEVFQSEGTK